MVHNQYYEGVLQLRNPTKEVISFIKNQCEKKHVLITKIIKEKEGFDYYITSRKFLHQIGKTLKQQFNGQLKVSPRLFSQDRLTSKNIYRVNVLFRLFPFKKGDMLIYRGEELKIVNIGTKVLAQNTTTGKKRWIDYDDLQIS